MERPAKKLLAMVGLFILIVIGSGGFLYGCCMKHDTGKWYLQGIRR